MIDSQPWFVGKDVAERLGYADTTNAMKQHCRGVVKHHPIRDSIGRAQNVRFLSEPDVLRLVAREVRRVQLSAGTAPKAIHEIYEWRHRVDAPCGRASARAEQEATRALVLVDNPERSILNRAFHGELLPQDRADEPAHVALLRNPTETTRLTSSWKRLAA